MGPGMPQAPYLAAASSPSSVIITVASSPVSSELGFLVPLRAGCQVLLASSLSVHSFVHSSVMPLLCTRDLGSCQVVGAALRSGYWQHG